MTRLKRFSQMHSVEVNGFLHPTCHPRDNTPSWNPSNETFTAFEHFPAVGYAIYKCSNSEIRYCKYFKTVFLNICIVFPGICS